MRGVHLQILSSGLLLRYCHCFHHPSAVVSSSAAALTNRKLQTTTRTIIPPLSSSTSALQNDNINNMSSPTTTNNNNTNNKVRIVSYNVLSSKLSRPSHFTHTNPEYLTIEYRLPLILSKLQTEMNRLEVSQSVGDDVDKIMADALSSTVDNTVKGKHKNTSGGGSGGSGGGGAMNNNKPPPTIFALQEICYPLTSALHTFFAKHGYTFITGLYGKKFNGYMGVGVAYPNEYFETVEVDICRLSDERVDGWPREEEEVEDGAGNGAGGKKKQGLVQNFRKVINQLVRNKFVKQLTTPFSNNNNNGDKEKTIDPWEMSENRFNVLVSVALRHRHNNNDNNNESGGTFLISNYHMPCAFYAPPVMNIHAEMVARRVQMLASNLYTTLYHQNDGPNKTTNDAGGGNIGTIPYILAGDFNIMPNSSHYQLLTTGILDEDDATFPPPKYDMKWTVQSHAMDSAYAMMSSSGDGGNDNDSKEGGGGEGEGEPEFTNYAHIQDQEDPFIGTLDYIFLSKKEKTTTTDAAAARSSSTSGKGKKDDDNVVGQWWKVNGVSKLPTVLNSGGPFPNAVEPSDHLLIAADLELVSKK
jgi:mRNA deadenylase 3'-5' endonuclease subunit Ccr4